VRKILEFLDYTTAYVRWNQTSEANETRIRRRLLRRPLRLHRGVEALSAIRWPRGRRSTEGAARASDCRVASPLPRPLHRGFGGRGGCVAVAERQNAVRALASETDFSHGTWSLTKLRLSF